MKLQNPDQSHKAIYGITRRGHICSEHGVGMVTYETFNQAVIVLSHELGHRWVLIGFKFEFQIG